MTNSTHSTDRRQAAAVALVQKHLADRAARLISARVNASGVNTWTINGHVVTLVPFETCDCQDRARRGVVCKHIHAARLLAGQPTQDAAPVAPARPRRPRSEPREELDW